MTRRTVPLIAALAIGAVGAVALACGSFSEDPSVMPDDEGGVDGGGSVDGATSIPDGSFIDGEADAGTDPAGADEAGCADGTREGFNGETKSIAACEGAWSVAGLLGDGLTYCKRRSGNDSMRPGGSGCGAEDLCAAGWHVCRNYNEVTIAGGAASSVCIAKATDGGAFFATAQPSDGTQICSNDVDAGFNDLFGCGSGGQTISSCPPLNVSIGTDYPLPNFVLGGDPSDERLNVIKSEGPGGVLCCRD